MPWVRTTPPRLRGLASQLTKPACSQKTLAQLSQPCTVDTASRVNRSRCSLHPSNIPHLTPKPASHSATVVSLLVCYFLWNHVTLFSMAFQRNSSHSPFLLPESVPFSLGISTSLVHLPFTRSTLPGESMILLFTSLGPYLSPKLIAISPRTDPPLNPGYLSVF